MKILKWFNLGLRLKIKEHDLKKIQKNNRDDTESCSCAMFSLWLGQSEDTSLQQLLEALCDVGELQAAKQLCEKFGKLTHTHHMFNENERALKLEPIIIRACVAYMQLKSAAPHIHGGACTHRRHNYTFPLEFHMPWAGNLCLVFSFIPMEKPTTTFQ